MTHPRIACLTMVKDEAFFLKIWSRYYGGLFGDGNLFVIDHNSDIPVRETLARPEANVLRIPFDHARPRVPRFHLVTQMVHMLKVHYDIVIFNDVDEIFVPDPAVYDDLRDYLGRAELRGAGVAGMGMELLHDHATEPAFDPDRPIFEQRSAFVYEPFYAKPHVIRYRCKVGAHGVSAPWMLDRDLCLVHLRFVDVGELDRRQAIRNDFYDRKLTGDRSNWRKPPESARGKLRWHLRRPAGHGDLPHKEWLRDYFGNEGGPLIGDPDGPPRRTEAERDVHWLADHLDPELGYTFMTARRHRVPERFRTV